MNDFMEGVNEKDYCTKCGVKLSERPGHKADDSRCKLTQDSNDKYWLDLEAPVVNYWERDEE